MKKALTVLTLVLFVSACSDQRGTTNVSRKNARGIPGETLTRTSGSALTNVQTDAPRTVIPLVENPTIMQNETQTQIQPQDQVDSQVDLSEVFEKRAEAQADVEAIDRENVGIMNRSLPVTSLAKEDVNGLSIDRVIGETKLDRIQNKGKVDLNMLESNAILDQLSKEIDTFSTLGPEVAEKEVVGSDGEKTIEYEIIGPGGWTNDDLLQFKDYQVLLQSMKDNAIGIQKDALIEKIEAEDGIQERLYQLQELMTDAGLEVSVNEDKKDDGKGIDKDKDKENSPMVDPKQEDNLQPTSSSEIDHHTLTNELASLEKQLQNAKDNGATEEEISAIQSQIDAKRKELDEYVGSHNNISGPSSDDQNQTTNPTQQTVIAETEGSKTTPSVTPEEIAQDIALRQQELEDIDRLIALGSKEKPEDTDTTSWATDPLSESIVSTLFPYTHDEDRTSALDCSNMDDAASIIKALPGDPATHDHFEGHMKSYDDTISQKDELMGVIMGGKKVNPARMDEELKGQLPQIIATSYGLDESSTPKTLGEAQAVIEKGRKERKQELKDDAAELAQKEIASLSKELGQLENTQDSRIKEDAHRDFLNQFIADPGKDKLNPIKNKKLKSEMLTEDMQKLFNKDRGEDEDKIVTVGDAIKEIRQLSKNQDENPADKAKLDHITAGLSRVDDIDPELEKLQTDAVGTVLAGNANKEDIPQDLLEQPLQPAMKKTLGKYIPAGTSIETVEDALDAIQAKQSIADGTAELDGSISIQPKEEGDLLEALTDYGIELESDKKGLEFKDSVVKTRPELIEDLQGLRDDKQEILDMKKQALEDAIVSQDPTTLKLYEDIEAIIQTQVSERTVAKMTPEQSTEKLFQILDYYTKTINPEIHAEKKTYTAGNKQYEMVQLVLPTISEDTLKLMQENSDPRVFAKALRQELDPVLNGKGMDYLVANLRYIFDEAVHPNIGMTLPRMVVMNSGLKNTSKAYKYLVLQYLDAMVVNMGSVPFDGDGAPFQVNLMFAIKDVTPNL